MRIVKLGDFYFRYPPNVKGPRKRNGINEIRVWGRAFDFADLENLRKVCQRYGPMIFRSAILSEEVVVCPLWSKGLSYRILLFRFKPIQLKLVDTEKDTQQDMGRVVIHPRFQLRFESNARLPKSIEYPSSLSDLRDWVIRVRSNKEMSCTLCFSDTSHETRIGSVISVGDKVSVLLGYEEMLEQVYSGTLTEVEETYSEGLELKAASNSPDPSQQTRQRFIYQLMPTSIIKLQVAKVNGGLRKQITSYGLPHLKPNDKIITVGLRTMMGRQIGSGFAASDVTHDLSRTGGFQTTFTTI